MDNFINNWVLHPITIRLATVIAGYIIIRLIVRLIDRTLIGRIENRPMRHQARKAANFASYLVLILLIALVFTSELAGFTVALGVATAGIAFALQEVIGSIAGWIAIMTGQFYDTGDRVQLGGITGDVIDIGILRTTLMEIGGWVKGDQYNGRTVRIANSFVFKEPVYNYSANFPFLWDEFTVPIKYGSNYDLARQLTQQATSEVVGHYVEFARQTWDKMLEHFLVEDIEIAPSVTMVFNDNWVEFTARYVVDFKNRRGTKDKIMTRLLQLIDESDGQIGLASATFHMVEWPPLDVRMPNQ